MKQDEQYKINSDIKLDVYKLEKDLAQMNRDCGVINQELRDIRNEVEKLKDSLVEIRADIRPFSKFIYAIVGILATGIGGAIVVFILNGGLA